MIIADPINIFPPEDQKYIKSLDETDEQLFANEAAAFDCVVHHIEPDMNDPMSMWMVTFAGEDEAKLRALINECGWGVGWAAWIRDGDRLVCTLL